jgi:hypothetical protein
MREFNTTIWAEAVRDFAHCGIQLLRSEAPGEVKRSPAGNPIFTALAPGVLNLVLTDLVPLAWDNGRGIAGVTTLHDGYHLCVISLRHAHRHKVPFLFLNTCVHELLHALLGDIFVARPKGWRGGEREFRIDAYATRMWLFRDGGDLRQAAQSYLKRLQAVGASIPATP